MPIAACAPRSLEATAPAQPDWTLVSAADGAIEVVVAALDPDSDEVRASAALLSDDEQRRASRFVFERDRRRFVVARARLRQLLAARLEVSPRSIELAYGEYGKPSLARCAGDSDLRFNVSHSEDLGVYVFGTGCELGVDVEAVREIPDAAGLAARFFSTLEFDAYLALEPHDRPLGFFNCWTRKEAFVKAIGEGLSYPLDSFDVSLAPGEPATILRVDRRAGDLRGWRIDSVVPAPGHVGAVVSRYRGLLR